MTPHIVDLLRFCCGYEHLEQKVLLRQHFFGIGHRTAYNNLIYCNPPHQLRSVVDIERLEQAPGALPRIECQLDPTVAENRPLWKNNSLVDFIDLKADGTLRFVLVDWVPTGKGAQKEGHKHSWVHWEQMLDSSFALEFLIKWERQHVLPQILRRWTAIKEGRGDEASSDTLDRFYCLEQWTDAQVFGSYDAVREEIASLRQQLESSEKRNQEPGIRGRRCVLNDAVDNYARSEQECRILVEQVKQLMQATEALRTTAGIPVGSLRDVLGHLKLTSSLTATLTKPDVTFMDPRTTREVFQICGVNLVVATLLFRQPGQKKSRLYQPEGPLWKSFDERINDIKNQLEGYNPYESAFRSRTATWDDEDRTLLVLLARRKRSAI